MSFIVLIIVGLAATALYSSSTNSSKPAPVADDNTSVEATPNNAYFYPNGPAQTIDGKTPHVATLKTSKGDIKIQLATDAPEAVNSFAFLAGRGFYDDTIFFYVKKDFVAQAGDPTCRSDGKTLCSGVGGPGYDLALEPAPSVSPSPHEQWSVAIPSLGEGRQAVHGSQFRIFYNQDSRLDGQETILGAVVEGQQILESLNDLAPCSFAQDRSCTTDLSGALVIKEVIVQPA